MKFFFALSISANFTESRKLIGLCQPLCYLFLFIYRNYRKLLTLGEPFCPLAKKKVNKNVVDYDRLKRIVYNKNQLNCFQKNLEQPFDRTFLMSSGSA